MQAIYQFLRENALESTLAMMQEESGFPAEDDSLADKPSHLLTAIAFYESQHEAAFAVRAVDPTFQQITQWMVREGAQGGLRQLTAIALIPFSLLTPFALWPPGAFAAGIPP